MGLNLNKKKNIFDEIGGFFGDVGKNVGNFVNDVGKNINNVVAPKAPVVRPVTHGPTLNVTTVAPTPKLVVRAKTPTMPNLSVAKTVPTPNIQIQPKPIMNPYVTKYNNSDPWQQQKIKNELTKQANYNLAFGDPNTIRVRNEAIKALSDLDEYGKDKWNLFESLQDIGSGMASGIGDSFGKVGYAADTLQGKDILGQIENDYKTGKISKNVFVDRINEVNNRINSMTGGMNNTDIGDQLLRSAGTGFDVATTLVPMSSLVRGGKVLTEGTKLLSKEGMKQTGRYMGKEGLLNASVAIPGAFREGKDTTIGNVLTEAGTSGLFGSVMAGTGVVGGRAITKMPVSSKLKDIPIVGEPLRNKLIADKAKTLTDYELSLLKKSVTHSNDLNGALTPNEYKSLSKIMKKIGGAQNVQEALNVNTSRLTGGTNQYIDLRPTVKDNIVAKLSDIGKKIDEHTGYERGSIINPFYDGKLREGIDESQIYTGPDGKKRVEISDHLAIIKPGTIDKHQELNKLRKTLWTANEKLKRGRRLMNMSPDEANSLNKEVIETKNKIKEMGTDLYTGGKLGDLIGHDILFNQYPALKGYDVKIETLGRGTKASFNEQKRLIKLDPSKIDEKSLGSILHEVQHAIQAKEDFSRGGGSEFTGKEYDRLYGEDEASTSARRANLTPEERKANHVTKDMKNIKNYIVKTLETDKERAPGLISEFKDILNETDARSAAKRVISLNKKFTKQIVGIRLNKELIDAHYDAIDHANYLIKGDNYKKVERRYDIAPPPITPPRKMEVPTPQVTKTNVKHKLAMELMDVNPTDKIAVKSAYKRAGYTEVDGFMVHPDVDSRWVKDLSPTTKQLMHDEGITYIDHTSDANGMAVTKNLGDTTIHGLAIRSDKNMDVKLFTNKDSTVAHEIGHLKWKNLSPQEQAQWQTKALDSGSSYIDRLKSGEQKSAGSIGEEAFAEDFALQKTGNYAGGNNGKVSPQVTKTPFKEETEISQINRILKNEDTVAGGRKIADYYREAKGEDWHVVEMSPDEYIRRSGKAMWGHESPEAIKRWSETANGDVNKYVADMKKGDKFPMPWIDEVAGSQEGRTRALAAKQLGYEKIPVAVGEKFDPTKVAQVTKTPETPKPKVVLKRGVSPELQKKYDTLRQLVDDSKDTTPPKTFAEQTPIEKEINALRSENHRFGQEALKKDADPAYVDALLKEINKNNLRIDELSGNKPKVEFKQSPNIEQQPRVTKKPSDFEYVEDYYKHDINTIYNKYKDDPKWASESDPYRKKARIIDEHFNELDDTTKRYLEFEAPGTDFENSSKPTYKGFSNADEYSSGSQVHASQLHQLDEFSEPVGTPVRPKVSFKTETPTGELGKMAENFYEGNKGNTKIRFRDLDNLGKKITQEINNSFKAIGSDFETVARKTQEAFDKGVRTLDEVNLTPEEKDLWRRAKAEMDYVRRRESLGKREISEGDFGELYFPHEKPGQYELKDSLFKGFRDVKPGNEISRRTDEHSLALDEISYSPDVIGHYVTRYGDTKLLQEERIARAIQKNNPNVSDDVIRSATKDVVDLQHDVNNMQTEVKFGLKKDTLSDGKKVDFADRLRQVGQKLGRTQREIGDTPEGLTNGDRVNSVKIENETVGEYLGLNQHRDAGTYAGAQVKEAAGDRDALVKSVADYLNKRYKLPTDDIEYITDSIKRMKPGLPDELVSARIEGHYRNAAKQQLMEQLQNVNITNKTLRNDVSALASQIMREGTIESKLSAKIVRGTLKTTNALFRKLNPSSALNELSDVAAMVSHFGVKTKVFTPDFKLLKELKLGDIDPAIEPYIKQLESGKDVKSILSNINSATNLYRFVETYKAGVITKTARDFYSSKAGGSLTGDALTAAILKSYRELTLPVDAFTKTVMDDYPLFTQYMSWGIRNLQKEGRMLTGRSDIGVMKDMTSRERIIRNLYANLPAKTVFWLASNGLKGTAIMTAFGLTDFTGLTNQDYSGIDESDKTLFDRQAEFTNMSTIGSLINTTVQAYEKEMLKNSEKYKDADYNPYKHANFGNSLINTYTPQVIKNIRGAKELQDKGYSENAGGRIQFEAPTDPWNISKSYIFGKNQTANAREYTGRKNIFDRMKDGQNPVKAVSDMAEEQLTMKEPDYNRPLSEDYSKKYKEVEKTARTKLLEGGRKYNDYLDDLKKNTPDLYNSYVKSMDGNHVSPEYWRNISQDNEGGMNLTTFKMIRDRKKQLKTDLGTAYDPLYDLPDDKAAAVLKYKSAPTGDDLALRNTLYKEQWFKDLKTAQTKFYESNPVDSTSEHKSTERVKQWDALDNQLTSMYYDKTATEAPEWSKQFPLVYRQKVINDKYGFDSQESKAFFRSNADGYKAEKEAYDKSQLEIINKMRKIEGYPEMSWGAYQQATEVADTSGESKYGSYKKNDPTANLHKYDLSVEKPNVTSALKSKVSLKTLGKYKVGSKQSNKPQVSIKKSLV